MKRRPFFLVLVSALMWMLISSHCPGGEVVTTELHRWAKQALKHETDQVADYSPNTLAVLYFDNATQRTEIDPLKKGLTVMLITDLSQIEEIQIVERVRLQALMEEMNLGSTGLVTGETAPRVGRILRAQYLVGGNLDEGQIPSDIRIDSDLLKVPAKLALGSPSSEGALEAFFKLEKDILFQIIDILKIDLTPDQKKRLRIPLSTNKKALFAFFRGIDSSDQKQYDAAAEHYKKALDEDPGLSPAREALSELSTSGLISKMPVIPPPPDETATQTDKTQPLLRGLRSRVSQNNQLQPTQSTKRLRTPDEINTISPGTTDVVVEWQ